MAALTKPYLNTKAEPDSVLPNLFPGNLPVAAATVLYANALVAKNASGYAVPASASPSQVVVGRVIKTYDNSGGAAGDIDAIIEQGAFDYGLASGANAVTVADIGAIVFAQDDNTISKTDQGGTLPVAGVLLNLYTPANNSTTRAIVQVGASLGFGASAVAGAPFKARAVVTSLAAYAAASGVLTASANGALGAQDGVTLAVGDVVMLPAVVSGGATVAAADAGPYVVTSLGSASSKYVLTRPAWFAHGAGIPLAATVDVASGTIYAGISWRSFAGKGAIVGTTDPAMYPRCVKGTQALTGGAATVSSLFVYTSAQACANDTTAAAAVKVVLTAGNGTGSLALTGTTTDTIAYVISNF